MFLLSKFFPKLLRPDKSDRGTNGEKPKDYFCKILFLDDTEINISEKSTAKGHVVLNKVYDHLNIIERDYFGMRYLDHGNQTHWLDPLKSLGSQLKYGAHHTLYFGVKFYSADPCKLHEEITRYQFFLQVKRDVLQGRLPLSFDMSADLCALAVQSELGDFDPKRHSFGYVSEFRFVPNQTEEMEQRIMNNHKGLVGLVPSSAEYRFLDKAKWMDMYGVDLHPVQGEGNVEYFVGLTPTGVVVYRNKSKVGNYFWPRITKVTFKAKMFMIRVKDKNNDENTYAFECTTKQACKHLWKCCVEHHAFFRLSHGGTKYQRGTGRFFNFGSKFRYSGRTERQALADASNRPAPKVVRTPSRRHERRYSGSENQHNGSVQLYQRSLSTGHVEGPVTTIINPEPVKTPSGQRKEYAGDSPRSTRSAPWSSNHHRKGGLYTTGRDSPMSVRSEKMLFPTHRRGANSGSESESGYNRRRHRREDSDNESEAASRRRARRRREAESGSESESGHHHRRHRHSRKSVENITYTEEKWKTVQSRIRNGGYDGVYDPYNGQLVMPGGSMTSIPASEASHHSKTNYRKRRTRSKSPGNKRPPEELAQHFRYVEPEPGYSEDQFKDIPYISVETSVPIPRRKHSPHSRHRQKRKSLGHSASQLPPESVRPPVSMYKNETQSAPIVKTRSCRSMDHEYQLYSAVSYLHDLQGSGYISVGPGSHYPAHNHQPFVGTMIDGPLQHDNNQQPHDQANNSELGKHIRDDSGLGAEQSEGGPSPGSQHGSSRSVPIDALSSPGTQQTPVKPSATYKSISKPQYIEQELSRDDKSRSRESAQSQMMRNSLPAHLHQQYNNNNSHYSTPPTNYQYYVPPYMKYDCDTSAQSIAKETTFSTPFKGPPVVDSPLGSLSRGVNSPFKPVVPSSQANSYHNKDMDGKNNNHTPNVDSPLSVKSSHPGTTVNSEVLRQVIASPGTNRDMLTEL